MRAYLVRHTTGAGVPWWAAHCFVLIQRRREKYAPKESLAVLHFKPHSLALGGRTPQMDSAATGFGLVPERSASRFRSSVPSLQSLWSNAGLARPVRTKILEAGGCVRRCCAP